MRNPLQMKNMEFWLHFS